MKGISRKFQKNFMPIVEQPDPFQSRPFSLPEIHFFLYYYLKDGVRRET